MPGSLQCGWSDTSVEGFLPEYQTPSLNHYCGPYSMLDGLNSIFWEKIKTARSRFHRGEIRRFPYIREPILHSWLRSKSAKVPYTGVPMALLPPGEFQEILRRNALFVDTAEQIMDELLENILPSKSCIILTDADGVYLQTTGEGIGFGRGTSCPIRGLVSREAIEGTTAMGLCLEEKRPVYVLGCEHYNPFFDGWSCASAPIVNEEGGLVGTLTLTLERDRFHQHTFGLVIAAAKAISEQLRLRRLLHETQTIMELLGEAVMVLDAAGTVRLLNHQAQRLLRADGRAVGRHYREVAAETSDPPLLAMGKAAVDVEGTVRLADGSRLHCLFSSSPTPEGGLCVTLREKRRMHALANRMTGAKAVYDFGDIKGDSPAMRQALRLAKKAADNAMTTLVLGESGVGKELFAQAIHNSGPRRNQPFIVVNCGAIPRDLVQSELFGYEPGAFTGANRQGAPGKFELADGGTVFLDEIGDMPLAAQTNLLRVLQEGEVTRLGGKHPCRVDVRVVAATHRDLDAAVANGNFRSDLYYRLNVLVIAVPPLRERPEDIAPLAGFFLDKIATTLRKPLAGFTPEALACLRRYPWPGNVRELENLVERSAVMAEGPRIAKADLPPEFQHPQGPVLPRTEPATPMAGPVRRSEPGSRHDEEARRLGQVLAEAGGNVRAAAKRLGISRVTLYARIRRCGLDLDHFRAATAERF